MHDLLEEQKMKRKSSYRQGVSLGSYLALALLIGGLLTLFQIVSQGSQGTASSDMRRMPITDVYLPIISKPPKLASAAAAHGVKVGVAASPGELRLAPAPQSAIAKTIRADFNSITPESAMKMQLIHPCPPAWLKNKYPEIQTWVDTISGGELDPGGQHDCGERPEEWHWQPMDDMVQWAKANNVGIYGHVLVWHSQNPGWLRHRSILDHDEDIYVISESDLDRIMREHIEAIIQRYCGTEYRKPDGSTVIYAIDVVNEAIGSDGQLFPGSIHGRQVYNPWYIIGNENDVLGDNYVRRAFEYTNQAVQKHCNYPITGQMSNDIELFYNDHSYEYGYNPPTLNSPTRRLYSRHQLISHFNGVYRLTQTLAQHNLIDGVGVQAHLYDYSEYSTSSHEGRGGTAQWVKTMSQFANLGLDIKVTELDVSLVRPLSSNSKLPCPDVANNILLRKSRWACNVPYSRLPDFYPHQASVFRQIAEACLQINQGNMVGKCTGFTTWGVHDGDSWREWFYPLMFESPTPNPPPTATPTRWLIATPKPVLRPKPSIFFEARTQSKVFPAPSRSLGNQPALIPKPAYEEVYNVFATSPSGPMQRPLPRQPAAPNAYPAPVQRSPSAYP